LDTAFEEVVLAFPDFPPFPAILIVIIARTLPSI
jgi:hypothetical protein